MTSATQVTLISCKPTTCICCRSSSRTRSWVFLFRRSYTYNTRVDQEPNILNSQIESTVPMEVHLLNSHVVHGLPNTRSWDPVHSSEWETEIILTELNWLWELIMGATVGSVATIGQSCQRTRHHLWVVWYFVEVQQPISLYVSNRDALHFHGLACVQLAGKTKRNIGSIQPTQLQTFW